MSYVPTCKKLPVRLDSTHPTQVRLDSTHPTQVRFEVGEGRLLAVAVCSSVSAG